MQRVCLRCAATLPLVEPGLRVLQVFIPGLIGTGQAFTTLDWSYPTVPQANLNFRNLTVNAGKALGGVQ